ncbi:RING/U-box superfamily protein [Euphorbia peplus]|nr:RING/U-box superfamily protein [Euphorbia peplus]
MQPNFDMAALTSPSPLSSSDHAFPLLAIAILSIISTTFLLFFYYFFINKCCSNWHNLITLRRGTRNDNQDDAFIAFSPSMWINRGLDESIIREIPTVQYRKGGEVEEERRGVFYGCVVCLNEFEEMDMVRVLPNCSHSFHLDCIDTWLQSNANCPLCRTSISGSTKYPFDQIIAPSSSPQGSQQPYSGTLIPGDEDEDFVVIELGTGENNRGVLPETEPETTRQRCQDQKKLGKLKPRKRQHVSIMGDECIDTREKDDQFSIQPIRRSFSLDSAVGQQLYLSVQAIIQQNAHERSEESSNSNSKRSVEGSFLLPFQLSR